MLRANKRHSLMKIFIMTFCIRIIQLCAEQGRARDFHPKYKWIRDNNNNNSRWLRWLVPVVGFKTPLITNHCVLAGMLKQTTLDVWLCVRVWLCACACAVCFSPCAISKERKADKNAVMTQSVNNPSPLRSQAEAQICAPKCEEIPPCSLFLWRGKLNRLM